MSPELARRKRTGTTDSHTRPNTPRRHAAANRTRAGLALAIGVTVLAALIVPAFASEKGEGDAPAPSASPASTTSTTVPATTPTTAVDAVEATLVSLTDEERLAMHLYFMSPSEREAFARFLAPPAPEPAPAPAPEPAPVEVEVAPVETVPAAPGGSVWDDLAYCETGGNWAHPRVGSYGYSGGLMFLPSTWTNYGGGEFAPEAYLASRDAQIIVAERILASHGGSYKAWPGCRSKLGLP
jgi:hypothetical protein